MILRGRRKITVEATQRDLFDNQTLVTLINTALRAHYTNSYEIDYLVAYRNGKQEILGKTKEVRPEINNRLVVNHAQMITRMVTGYFLGTPIQYVQAGADKKDELEQLNRAVMYEDKASVDKEIAEMQSVCGTAYRIIFTDGLYADEVPFEDRALNPSTTFVAYENTIAERPLFGVTYLRKLDALGNFVGMKIFCYTDSAMYTFVTEGEYLENNAVPLDVTPYSVGGVPIIEYPNNVWRIGDWELVIGLMEAINSVQSGRMDDIDQVIQSLLVFINADIDEEKYKEMRAAGVLCLTNKTEKASSVEAIETSLDQNGMNSFSKELEELLYALVSIPDRNNRGGSGGDTGAAVELRDGWADLEIVARNKELVFKKSEKQALKIMITILNNKQNLNLSLMDVAIKFSRNKNNNLLVKTQAYMNLIGTKTLDPADCLTIVDLVSDVNDFIERGKSFWQDSFAGKASEQSTVTDLQQKGEPDPVPNNFGK